MAKLSTRLSKLQRQITPDQGVTLVIQPWAILRVDAVTAPPSAKPGPAKPGPITPPDDTVQDPKCPTCGSPFRESRGRTCCLACMAVVESRW